MRLTSVFIDRPVLAIVLNITIVLAGLAAIAQLGVRDYPAVDPPVITVSTGYGGASADVIESKITEPLEESVNGIAGIRTLTSASSDGWSTITVEFNLGTDLEAAANDVRDRVSRALRSLPSDADPPVVSKADASSMPIMLITLRSDTRDPMELSDYAVNVFRDPLQTIADVSEVRVWGERKRAMRLWMDPARMRSCGVTPQDIVAALGRQNIELPSGRIEGATSELTIRTMGRLESAGEFAAVVVADRDGRVVRFGDIGEAFEGPENDKVVMKFDGVPMVGVAIVPQPGANHVRSPMRFTEGWPRFARTCPRACPPTSGST